MTNEEYKSWQDAYSEPTRQEHELQTARNITQAFDETRFKVKDNKLEAIDETIKEIQAERGNVYGAFEHQAVFVGKTLHELISVADDNGKALPAYALGSFAYIVMKLARLAVTPDHKDTLIDLESYCNLMYKMHYGEK